MTIPVMTITLGFALAALCLVLILAAMSHKEDHDVVPLFDEVPESVWWDRALLAVCIIVLVGACVQIAYEYVYYVGRM